MASKTFLHYEAVEDVFDAVKSVKRGMKAAIRAGLRGGNGGNCPGLPLQGGPP